MSFETYNEQFSALLHIEETQMQRDIRNYDLKDVTFERDTRNPKLLVLRVKICFLFSVSFLIHLRCCSSQSLLALFIEPFKIFTCI